MSSERLSAVADPAQIVLPESIMTALKTPLPKLPEADAEVCAWDSCDIRQPAAIAGQSVASTSPAQ